MINKLTFKNRHNINNKRLKNLTLTGLGVEVTSKLLFRGSIHNNISLKLVLSSPIPKRCRFHTGIYIPAIKFYQITRSHAFVWSGNFFSKRKIRVLTVPADQYKSVGTSNLIKFGSRNIDTGMELTPFWYGARQHIV